MLKDFNKVADMPQEVIEKYKNKVPAELLQIWEEDGLGTFLNGYLKVINPEDYLELVQETYFRGDVSVPIFVTAFGDVITLEEGKTLRNVMYREGNFKLIPGGMKYFVIDLEDKEFIEESFDIDFYQEAIEKHGELDYNQCFGFVPLLALGGFKDADHLDKVKIFEHIMLITQLVGGIGME
ncbi:T6SS immunity protein Tdi1 domain-containing protein [Streptococcus dentapri]|uniref:T6SS immunity protein Tdi1 domain-containing protein n=1 Tax=Streptococcus dentapri TaxID=573564 RepID=A0ABV8D1W9_9STRE